MREHKLLPFPNGWFSVGFSKHLQPGELMTRRFMGQEVVVFRTQGGLPVMIDAYCPHLGAHFGHGGRVAGEALHCPFHDFTFDHTGTCVSTLYGSKPPPKAVVRTWSLHEVNGILFAYNHTEMRPPEWELPALDWQGWTGLLTQEWEIRGHPQDICENGLDLGHLTVIHKYAHVQILKDLSMDGPFLSAAYTMQRSVFSGLKVRSEFEVVEHGLGFSVVEVKIPAYHLTSRLMITSTPIDGEKIALRIAISVNEVEQDLSRGTKEVLSEQKIPEKPGRFHHTVTQLPRRLFYGLIARLALNGFAHDIQQDFPIWQNKIYVDPPALAKGDGPIGKFRQWAKQFYSI